MRPVRQPAYVTPRHSPAQFEGTFDTGTRTTPTTDDHLDTIRDTKPTVSAAMAQEFTQQTERFARI
ncbi:hypothetical protein [Streptomyces sp. NPDC052107]|uniref:hypothetical protein n=1 Tax=Streptomyces sp. NPDC052107 TaxID=3155632 RepID=UPI00342A0166